MNLTPQVMAKEVAATGFGAEPLEKVFRLMALIDALGSHPFLKPRIALKGGTALNLFHFEVPRLSVDIDMNYIGAVERETMLAEKPKVEQAVQAVCSRALAGFKLISVLLAPILPRTASRVARELFGLDRDFAWSDAAVPPERIEPYRHLLTRIDPKQVDALIEGPRAAAPVAADMFISCVML